MEFALEWDEISFARENIDIEQLLKIDPCDDIMYTAIMEDRYEFVRLLLENGFDLNSFLTRRRLLKLYNDQLYDNVNESLYLRY